MTPRMSNIGASIRKMFSGIGWDGDYYWDNVVLALRMDGVKIVSVTRGTTLGRSTAPFYIGNLNNRSTQHRYMGYIETSV